VSGNVTTNHASAIVLAGGRSTRMGQPKALLPFGGEPLIARVVAVLQPRFAEVIVVAAPDQTLPSLPVVLVRDEVAYRGPVGGLYHGLSAARGEIAFATSCDSVFLNVDLIAYLVSRAPGHDVVVPSWQGRDQPLHAVYRKTVAPLLGAQLAADALRLADVFEKVRTCRIDEKTIRRFDPGGLTFFNMNTPADYADALARWKMWRAPR
jgi:molybdopterin-guanine dinucleotide biosynthesis protein A